MPIGDRGGGGGARSWSPGREGNGRRTVRRLRIRARAGTGSRDRAAVPVGAGSGDIRYPHGAHAQPGQSCAESPITGARDHRPWARGVRRTPSGAMYEGIHREGARRHPVGRGSVRACALATVNMAEPVGAATRPCPRARDRQLSDSSRSCYGVGTGNGARGAHRPSPSGRRAGSRGTAIDRPPVLHFVQSAKLAGAAGRHGATCPGSGSRVPWRGAHGVRGAPAG